MVSVYQLKSRFQTLLRPLVNKLAVKGFTANQVTIAAAAISLCGGGCLLLHPERHWPWLMLPILLFVRMALNAIDGMLAREYNMKSRLGAVLNELGDVVSDTALYLPFALIPNASGWLVVVICVLAIISEMTGIIAIQIGATRRYDGPMGKSDRAFVFGTIGLLLGFGMPIGIWLNTVLAIVIILLGLTIYNRAAKAIADVHDD